jgi:hypothetical protein
MKVGLSIAAIAAGMLVLSACSDADERTAENEYRDASPSSSTYPENTPPPVSTTPGYPTPDPTTIPPTTNPDAPVNPDGTLPPNIPPASTPPTLN